MFEMREPLVRQIIFAMENQNISYLIDTERGTLLRPETIPAEQRPDPEGELDPEHRYQPIPPWTSADGFQLMERFVNRVQLQEEQDQLQEILVSGKRVFRRFKDALKENEPLAQRFYQFKYQQMRGQVLDWYDRLRELAGLDIVERGVDEEFDDLWQSNVSVLEPRPVPVTVIRELDRQASAEVFGHLPEPLRGYLRQRRRSRLPSPGDARCLVLAASTPMEDLCGFAWLVGDTLPDGGTVHELVQLYVLPEYRGLGIGTALLDAAVTRSRETGGHALLASVPAGDGPIRQAFERLSARHHAQQFVLTSDISPAL